MGIGGWCTWETVWRFNTARFQVKLQLAQDVGHQYDGDDENGETQAALDSGEYIAFDSRVVVYFDGREIGADYLGGSVYGCDTYQEFFMAHRDPNPENRNCAATNAKYSVCHYFPDMVRQAVAAARKTLSAAPKLRVQS